jgi:proliferating cell nuclear antigen
MPRKKTTKKTVNKVKKKELVLSSDEEVDLIEVSTYTGTTIILMEDGTIFKKIMDLLKDVLEVGIFIINEDGISLQSLDSAHISFIQMLLHKNAFSKFIYNKNREEDLELAISMESLCNVLKCMNVGEQITISHNEEDSKVSWTFENPDIGSYKNFNLNLLNDESQDINIPKSNFDCRIKTLSSEFQLILKNLAYIGDYVNVCIDKDNNIVDFKSAGIHSDGLIRLKKNNHTKLKLTENFDSKFSLKYLQTYAKSASFSSTVSIHLKENSPVSLEYKIDHLSGIIRYFIAPKSRE